MNKIKEIDLSNNKLSEIPVEIINLENLQYLDLSSNPISKLPKEMSKMKNLKEITLTDTGLSAKKAKKYLPAGVQIIF